MRAFAAPRTNDVHSRAQEFEQELKSAQADKPEDKPPPSA
jgi:hypothetical protein